MNRKQRRINQSQDKNKPAIVIHGRPYAPEEASMLAFKEKNSGNFLAAVEIYNLILAQFPDHAETYINRGNIQHELRRYKDALASYDKAITLKTGHPSTYYNRGFTLQALRRYTDALASFDKALALKPDYMEAHNSRGLILQELHRYSEALASYDKAIALQPAYADAYYNKGLIKLLLGEFEEGWKLYEWRWKSVKKNEHKSLPKPLWTGKEALEGKTLLLHAEQGLGDTIQLCRYVPLLETMGANILLSVPLSLKALMSGLKGSFHLLSEGDPLPGFDLHCPLFSLPLALGTGLNTIPANVPYLFADLVKGKMWQDKLGQKSKPRIGLVWSGAAKHKNDHSRSIALHTLAPLLSDKYEFHSLQTDIRPDDAHFFVQQSQIVSHGGDLKDFTDTAALISEMDLVISVDTSVAHLAGALGKKVWILLPHTPDFRWLLERDDSPWYPTACLFRQPRTDDWASVISDLKEELEAQTLDADAV